MTKFINTLLVFCAVFSSLVAIAQEPPITIEPRHYVCYQASGPVTIDGLLREPDWNLVPWSELFVDIEGSLKPNPVYATRIKMLWDSAFLYIAAQLEEPHVWATLRQRDTVIFYDNDFEVFIDPDGDTHHYLEYEMNALNTQWDLLLLKPYRDENSANVAIDHWNYNGLKSAVYVDGTLNNPVDTDKGWTIEIAFPLDALAEVSLHGKKPLDGEQYRINFSRVEWETEIQNGRYVKSTHWVNGVETVLPEHNWVWSPQGVIAMHQPETWGFVQFSEKKAGYGTSSFVPDPDNDIKWALRMLYYRESGFYRLNSRYTDQIMQLQMNDYLLDGKPFLPEINLKNKGFEAVYPSHSATGKWHIANDGRIWKD